MNKIALISTEKFCNLILALLGVEGVEYDGFGKDDDLRIIAMIGFFMTVYVVSDKLLRIKLTF